MEVDYSSTCDEKLPVAESLAKAGKLNDALDMLMSLEKQCRTGADTHSNGRVLVLVVKLCAEVRYRFKCISWNFSFTKRNKWFIIK